MSQTCTEKSFTKSRKSRKDRQKSKNNQGKSSEKWVNPAKFLNHPGPIIDSSISPDKNKNRQINISQLELDKSIHGMNS